MKNKTVEGETRMYVYDLMNAAKEYGFKGEDHWELSLATDAEKVSIQRNYYPTIAQKVYPDILLEVYNLTRSRLNQALDHVNDKVDNRSVLKDELTHIVAFNPKRQRT
jgi:hypothetical protein